MEKEAAPGHRHRLRGRRKPAAHRPVFEFTPLQLALKGKSFPYLYCIRGEHPMLAKLTSKNRLTLPKAVVADFQGSEYFDVTKENGRIVLTPVRLNRADAVRAKLAELGMSEADVAEAVAWARRAL
jgi:hypothetical protein